MPAASQQQRGLIFGKRNQYGSIENTPKKWKWVWEEGWENKGKLPKYKKKKKKLNESKIITFTQMINELYSKLNEGYYDDINGWISTSQNNSGFKDNDQVQTSDGKYKGTVYDVMVSPDKKDICVVVKWTNGTVTKYGRMDRNKELGKDWGDITTIKKLNESKILTFNDIIES